MEIGDFLRQFSVFKDLNDSELDEVIQVTVERTYQKGEYVFMQGQYRDYVYFVRRGLIKVFKVDPEGREHVVNILGAGQMFPHVGFFDDSPYPGTAEALAPTNLLAIRSQNFERLLFTNPDMMRKVMRVLGQKILFLQEKVQELALYDGHDRVLALLRHFADEHGKSTADGIHVKLHVTDTEMAQMIGMTRESVNRMMNQLRKEGIVSGTREEWVLHISE